MSGWRGQGGKRAKGRRDDQDPQLDNTAWLAELEQQAAQADDDEEDWATTLRGRRAPAQPPASAQPPAPAPPSYASDPPLPAPSPPAEPSWMPPADPAPPPPDYRLLGVEPDRPGWSGWDADPATQGPPVTPTPVSEPDWSSGRPTDRAGFAEPRLSEPPVSERAGPGESRRADPPGGEGFWDSEWPVQAEPDRRASGADPGQEARPAAGADTGQEAWPAARADPPTGAWPPPEPAGREPDYPALFGELYRRSAAQLDPIWEAPPAAEPLPEPGQPDPSAAAWPFEETTQSWEPSDRSFIWPADELPTTPTEWEPGASRSWLDDPAPAPQPPTPPSDQTAGWPGSGPTPQPPDQTSAWPGSGPTPQPPDPTARGRPRRPARLPPGRPGRGRATGCRRRRRRRPATGRPRSRPMCRRPGGVPTQVRPPAPGPLTRRSTSSRPCRSEGPSGRRPGRRPMEPPDRTRPSAPHRQIAGGSASPRTAPAGPGPGSSP